jgi:hypothetical protein
MISLVDEDGSGKIEFGEFLSIIKNQANPTTAKINRFFKDMASGSLAGSDLSFNMLVQKIRRDYMLDAIMSPDPTKREFGERILKNSSKQTKWMKWSNE